MSRLLLLVQFLLAAAFGWLIFVMTMRFAEGTSVLSFEEIGKLWSKALVLILTLFINVMFRIKHRARNPEGELLPMMFLFMTLECSTILPDYFIETGKLFLDPVAMNVMVRFSLLFCSALFVFKSLTFMGTTTGQTGNMVLLSFIVTLVFSMFAPNDSLVSSAVRNFGSVYDTYFYVAIQIMNLCSLITFIVAAVTDKTGHNIKRSITYALLMIGNFGIFLYSAFTTIIIMDVLFLTGAVMLLTRTRDSYW